MKIGLELITNDSATFLNYWDRISGNDVCCEITVYGKIMLTEYELNSEDELIELPAKEITLLQFIELVKTKVK